jgi:hypothetical protein
MPHSRFGVIVGALLVCGACTNAYLLTNPETGEPLLPRSTELSRRKANWLVQWKQRRTFDLAVEFLELYSSGPVQPVARGGEGIWMGKVALVRLTAEEAVTLLGGQDDETDFTRDIRISDDEWVKIEDTAKTDADPGIVPVKVEVIQLRAEGKWATPEEVSPGEQR